MRSRKLKILMAAATLSAPLFLAVLILRDSGPSVAATPGTYVIADDDGGYIHVYEERFRKVSETKDRVVIDGECSSSCTLVLSYVSLDRICVTPRAQLGFHAPTEEDDKGEWVPSPEGVKEVMALYPAPVRAWINKNGGLNPDMIFLGGAELRKILRHCT